MNPPPVVTRDNWKGAVREAVEALPDDVQSCVAWEQPTTRRLAIRIAVELCTGDPEGQVNRVVLRWWDTVREQEAAYDQAAPATGGRKLYATGDPRWDWPVVSISSAVVGLTQGLFAGRATVATLKEHVQVAVLEEMCANGSEMVLKDQRDCFIRKDGRLLLAWQIQDSHR